MKKFTFLFVFAFAAMCANVSAAEGVVKKWDFTVWSDATIANFTADANSESPAWYCHEFDAENGNALKRFKNWGKSVATIVANGVEVEETKGILFPVGLTGGLATGSANPNTKGVFTDGKGDLSIRFNFGDNGIQCGSSSKVITIKDLKKDQKVTIVIKSASNGTPRGISAATNMAGAVADATYGDGKEEITYNFVVNDNADATFTYSGGIILKSITVVGETTSINSINNSAKAIIASEYFDVTGKKVNADAKGFVIVKTTYEDGSCNTAKTFNK